MRIWSAKDNFPGSLDGRVKPCQEKYHTCSHSLKEEEEGALDPEKQKLNHVEKIPRPTPSAAPKCISVR